MHREEVKINNKNTKNYKEENVFSGSSVSLCHFHSKSLVLWLDKHESYSPKFHSNEHTVAGWAAG